MPTDNSHISWETPSDKTSVSCASKSDFLKSSIVIPGQCNFSCSREGPQNRDLRLRKHTPYRKWAGLEAMRLATTKLTQRRLSILKTPYPTQNLQRKHRNDSQMTTKARKRTMNPGLMKIGVWNVRGLNGKEKLLQEELKKANVDIAVIPETKKKLKGLQELDDYILL